MRISETQLRRMVRQAINEMPLRNLDPVRNLREPGKQQKTVSKIYGSPAFAKKLRNFLSSWSTNFYVAPLYGDIPIENEGRVEILGFDEFAERHSDNSKVSEALNSYSEIADPNSDCLILPMAIGTNPDVALTPWMIFHAMFDDEWRATESFFPTAWKIRDTLEEMFQEIFDDYYASIKGGRSGRLSNDEHGDAHDNLTSAVESIFTFGSARGKYFTKHMSGDFTDAANESAVQSLLKDGFRYNPDAIDHIAELAPGFDVEKWKAKFEKVASMSSAAKREADSNLHGKVILVGVA